MCTVSVLRTLLCVIYGHRYMYHITPHCARSIRIITTFSTTPPWTPEIASLMQHRPLLSHFSHHLTIIHKPPRQICNRSNTKLYFMKMYTKCSYPSPFPNSFWVQTLQVLQRPCSHTHRATQLRVSRIRNLAWEVLSTEDAGNAFSRHNSLATPTGVKLCLSMSKMYLCLYALPQSWRERKQKFTIKESLHDLCSWWYTAHQNLHTCYWGMHPLWPRECAACELKTQLQFYHLSSLPPKKERKKRFIWEGYNMPTRV